MAERTKVSKGAHPARFREWLAFKMGVRPERKETIYLQVAESASLRDVSYWLQILFSAGIATLGLVLNSPAVIIGAMLISPLMGPILANGLALAAGDLVLGVRAIVTLTLSCAVAVAFAVLLVALLPFKEVTNEIAARTHPNTLDLVIALFSGAIGSIAICKEAKGVVTSIPGVAIAVALMPPLCVVGFGLGVAVSLNAGDGMPIAWGGGLLFLTNLVAITFTAMIVFLLLHIDTQRVRERVREWRAEDKESSIVRNAMKRLPAFERLRIIGGLPGRLLLILIIISLITVPLSNSFSQLKQEIAKKQQENRIRQVATEIWEQNFSKMPDGSPRCYLGQLSILNPTGGKLDLLLRVFTSKPLTDDEKSTYTDTVATRLSRPPQSVGLQLIEIPTATSDLLTRAKEERPSQKPEPVLTFPELQADFSQAVATSLGSLKLPPPARLVNYEIATNADTPLHVELVYLSDREIETDAQNLIFENVRDRLHAPNAPVTLERIDTSWGSLTFGRNQSAVTEESASTLDRLGAVLQQQPKLIVEVTSNAEKREPEGITEERARAVAEYLSSKYQVAADRIKTTAGTDTERSVVLKINLRQSAQ